MGTGRSSAAWVGHTDDAAKAVATDAAGAESQDLHRHNDRSPSDYFPTHWIVTLRPPTNCQNDGSLKMAMSW